jgi:16S rRNA (cytosine1402-N4)-methyltransferase
LGRRPGQRVNPATKTFQALRIAVNDELTNVERGLEAAVGLLAGGGRLVVISYHSLEDRIVKSFFNREAATCVCPPDLPVCVCHQTPRIKIINRRVIKPSEEEVRSNPRSRSAKLRIAQRT